MRLKVASLLLVSILLASMVPTSIGYSNGKYSSGSSGCSCHGYSSATVSMSGQPSSYTPGTTYTLQITVSTGSGNGGFSLDANKGTLSTGGGVGIMSVKVNSAGTSATHTTNSYRSWSVDWIAPSSGSGSVQFDLSGVSANGNGANSGDVWGSTTITVPEGGGPAPNNPPSASGLQFTPSNPVTTDTLTLSYTYQDQDGDSESGTKIRWYKDGQLISSRNDQTTVPPSLTSKGETWNVTVTPSDGTDDGTPVHSSNLLVVNSMPMITSAEITPEDALESDDLSLIHSSSDADNDVRTVSATEWYVDGSKVTAFDGDTTIPSVAIRDGDVWYAKIKVNDGEVDSDWFTTQDVTIGSDNTPPVLQSVSISGGPFTTVDDIQATAQATDADNDALTYEWDWPGTMGAVSSSMLPSFYTEKGESWKVRVRVTDGEVYSDWMESNLVVIQNTAPVLSSLTINQDEVYFAEDATYTYEASDIDGDQLTVSESWSLNGDLLTLTLSVSDDDMANSNTLTDTVVIANSLPTLAYNGEVTQTALVDLSPQVDSDDANGDTVSLTWQWMRNGFMTDETGPTISANKLGAGDIWTAMVTPNDGMDDGQILSIDFTISNTAPVAVITAPEKLVKGAMVTFSATDSTDVDGAVVTAIWSVDGAVMHNGMTFTTTMTSALSLEVKVIDDLGANDVTSQSYIGTAPPSASNVNAKLDGSDVVITWQGDAEDWAILHNGEQIGTTPELKFRHTPTIEGQHNYSVLAIIDGQVIQDESAGISDSVELTTNLVAEAPGPSETAGLVFSIVMLLIGLVGIGLSFMPRRD
jgi:hypothetical protein